MKNSLFFFACLFNLTIAAGQKLDSIVILNNRDFKKLPFRYQAGYKDENGKYFGCGWSLGCLFSELSIIRAVLNKRSGQIEIEGYYSFFQKMSQPFDFEILLGRPSNDTLKIVKTISYIKSDHFINPRDSTPVFGNGYFHVSFTFTENDKLYIDAGSYMALKEYDIGFLLRQKKSKR